MIKVWTHRGHKTYELATDYQIDRHGIYLLNEDGKEIARYHPDQYTDVANVDLCGAIGEGFPDVVGLHFPARLGE